MHTVSSQAQLFQCIQYRLSSAVFFLSPQTTHIHDSYQPRQVLRMRNCITIIINPSYHREHIQRQGSVRAYFQLQTAMNFTISVTGGPVQRSLPVLQVEFELLTDILSIKTMYPYVVLPVTQCGIRPGQIELMLHNLSLRHHLILQIGQGRRTSPFISAC